MFQFESGKKFSFYFIVILIIVIMFQMVNPSQIKKVAWHVFNSENVVYKGIKIKVPSRWWIDKSDETSIVFFRDMGKGKEPIMVSLGKESFDFNRENIAKAIKASCATPLTADKVEIDGKEAIRVRCSPKEGGNTYIWFVADTKTVLMSDAPLSSNIGWFDELFSNIRWH